MVEPYGGIYGPAPPTAPAPRVPVGKPTGPLVSLPFHGPLPAVGTRVVHRLGTFLNEAVVDVVDPKNSAAYPLQVKWTGRQSRGVGKPWENALHPPKGTGIFVHPFDLYTEEA